MKTKQKISNYEKMKNQMAGAFLQYDQEKMIRKFGLTHDDGFLYIFCLNRKYRIDRLTGQVGWSEDAFQTEERADYNEAMTIYDVLCYSKEDCCLAHEWANVGTLSSIQGGTLEKGDVAYELQLFPFLPLILRFWDADEDFPASLQILVDKNILDYMHYETLMFAISHLLERLRAEM